jgi:hypothetical protein
MMQEIVLASNTAVLCGSHSLDWDSFQKAAKLIWYCKFLHKRKQDYTLLLRTIFVAHRRTQELSPDLAVLVAQFINCQASDSRDRIFGLLGI